MRKKARGSGFAVSLFYADSAAFDPNKDKPRFRDDLARSRLTFLLPFSANVCKLRCGAEVNRLFYRSKGLHR